MITYASPNQYILGYSHNNVFSYVPRVTIVTSRQRRSYSLSVITNKITVIIVHVWQQVIMIKLCCYRRPLTPLGTSGGPYHITTVLFLSRDVKISKLNEYLHVVLTSFNVSDSRFRKLVMFSMRRHYDKALWRHGGGTWQNDLFRTTASNVNCWVVANHATRL